MPLLSRQGRATLSYAWDCAGLAMVVGVLWAWLSDALGTPPGSPPLYLSPTFADAGFCNTPEPGVTQMQCARFDFTAGAVLLLSCFYHGVKASAAVPLAAYVVVHGFGHYRIATGVDLPEGITPAAIPIFFAIISIGPFKGVDFAVRAGTLSKGTARVLALASTAALVALYVLAIGKTRHALLYINVAITLAIFVPRVALVGVTDARHIAIRADHAYFYASLLSGVVVMAVIVLEPLFCDALVVRYGGHLLFDMSLAVSAFVDVANATSSKAPRGDRGSKTP